MKSPDRDAADDTYLSLAEWVGTIVVLATQQNDPELREAVRDFPISFPDGAPVATEIALLVGRFANQASELATLRRRVAEALGMLAEYRYRIQKPDLELRSATILGDQTPEPPDEPAPFTLQIEFDDAADYKRAWLAIEQMPEVVNIGFLSGTQFVAPLPPGRNEG